jgi:uncharacterized phage protein (TIGR01671 family)
MREIKFRGKMVNAEKWLYGNLQVPCKEGVPYYMLDEDKYQRQVDVKTIGQYTGLKDKNGKEIYEGDILRVEEFKNESDSMEKSEEFYEAFDLEDMKGEKRREYITPVCWEDGAFVISARQENDTFLCVLYGDMRRSFPIFVFEVIGNIHDNPELLTK